MLLGQGDTMSPSPRGFDAYCRKAETGGTVERICVALDVGLRPPGSACGCRGHPGARGPAIVGRGDVAGMVAAIFKQTHARF